MTRHHLLHHLTLLPLAVALAGCGGAGSGEDTRQQPLAVPQASSAAAPDPTTLGPTVYDPERPDQVHVGTIILGDDRYSDVVVTWDQLLAVGTDEPTQSWNRYDATTGQLSLPRVQVGDLVYTNAVVTVSALLSVGGIVPVGPLIPDDPLFGEQWHLLNRGQAGPDGVAGLAGEDLHVSAAWNEVAGAGVRIAVVDDGLDISHADLNIADGKSWDYRVDAYGDPSSASARHGTASAGLAAARGHNGNGVTGVAFMAQLVGYNLLAASTAAHAADAVVKDLADNQIYLNGSGAPDGTGLFVPSSQSWRDAIDSGLRNGRAGKGVVYTWAAGNGAPLDRAGYDEQASHPGVLAIAALNDHGQASSGSEPGANVLVSAYGGESCAQHALTTTDVSGNGGFNNGASPSTDIAGAPDFTRCSSGSGAAAAQVAGVAALMLERNPALGWRDVRTILAHTARQNDASDSGWALNAGGLKVHPSYGFGTVDAWAAVQAARNWQNLPPQTTASASDLSASPILDAAAPLVKTLTLAGSGIAQIEFVELLVNSDHPDAGQLEIVLTSPAGTRQTLAVPRSCRDDAGAAQGCGAGLLGGFRFGVAQLMDEPADGKWQLSVRDAQAGGSGFLVSWGLRVYGH